MLETMKENLTFHQLVYEIIAMNMSIVMKGVQ